MIKTELKNVAAVADTTSDISEFKIRFDLRYRGR